MATDTAKIILKIQKLLKLAENGSGATPAEAESAMLKAHELMAAHNIAAGALTDDDVPVEVILQAHVNPWARRIYSAVAELNFCEFYFARTGNVRKGYSFFVGQEGNAQVAMEIAHWCVKSLLKQGSKQGRTRELGTRWVTSFMEGAADQIAHRVAQILEDAKADAQGESTGTALVLASVYDQHGTINQQWLTDNRPALVQETRKRAPLVSAEGYLQGKKAGDSINLNTQVGGNSAPAADRLH